MSSKITLNDMINTPMNITQYEDEKKESKPKKIGRPKGRKRNYLVSIYCTEEEKQRFQEEADKNGLGLTQYARMKIFGS